MMMGKVESALLEGLKQEKALFFNLLDPDSAAPETIIAAGQLAAENGADALLLGGSFIGNPNFIDISRALKKTGKPIILFPGGSGHVTPGPDAILFTSLVSGRNPQYLIDEQVKGAFLVKKHGIEAIPTAYLLVESGKTTAVEWISNTRPLPADKPAIAAAHVLAAEMLGMRWAYLEAGSGAQNPVPLDMIAAARALTTSTLIVGGGIRTPEQAAERVRAGAHAIVIGNHFEKHRDPALVTSFAQAIHRG